MDLRAPNVQEYAKRTSRIFHFDCVTFCCLLLIWMYSAESVKRTFFLVPNTYKDLQIQRRALHFIVYKTFVQIFLYVYVFVAVSNDTPYCTTPYQSAFQQKVIWEERKKATQFELRCISRIHSHHCHCIRPHFFRSLLPSAKSNHITLLCVYAWSQFIFRFHSVVFFSCLLHVRLWQASAALRSFD